MQTLIIDPTCNLSGAPRMAAALSQALGAPIAAIRKEPAGFYEPAVFGAASLSVWGYIGGHAALLLKPGFWHLFWPAKTIIANTCLSFLFLALARIFGKRTILFLHESSKKNLLYRLSIFVSLRVAHRVVTPSRSPFLDLGISKPWQVIANCLPENFLTTEGRLETSVNSPLRVLFTGDSRREKGGELYQKIKTLVAAQGRDWLLTSIAERKGNNRSTVVPDDYEGFDIALNLTDNRYWRETFGLMSFEAAARGCVPVSTDQFAVREYWQRVSDQLIVKDYGADAVIEALVHMEQNTGELAALKLKVAEHSRTVCAIAAFERSWRKLNLNHQKPGPDKNESPSF